MPSPIWCQYEACRKGITESSSPSRVGNGCRMVCGLQPAILFASVVYVLDDLKCFGCFLKYNGLAEKYLQM